MAKIAQMPALDIVDALRGKLDYYTWCNLVIVRSWPQASDRARSEDVQATGARFAYVNEEAGSLDDSIISAYKELASDTGFSWKDFLTRNFISGTEKLNDYQV